MTQNNSHLVDSLNLFTLLIFLKQNPQLINTNNNIESYDTEKEENKNYYKSEKLEKSNKTKEKKQKNNNKEKLKKHTFWDELHHHAQKVNYVKIKIMADGPGSEFTGYLVNLHKDFLTLVNEGEKIYIPIDKILTFKLKKEFEKNNNKKTNNNDNTQTQKNQKQNSNNNEIKKENNIQLKLPFYKLTSFPKSSATKYINSIKKTG
ncbi:MAG: hypothetical protein ACOCQ5_02755 [Halanaerobiales bacterium]